MDEQKEKATGTGPSDGPMSDMDEGPHVGFISSDEFEERAVETHTHARRHDTSHHTRIDLDQEEYTPDQVARLMGTSLEVVMHAIWRNELKAKRTGHDVVAIKHEDVVDWLRRRGPGV